MADHPVRPFDPAGDRDWSDLESRLQDLAGQVRFPPTPDLAATTRRMLAEQDARRTPLTSVWSASWSRLAIAAAILILLAASVLAVSSPARDAVARWLDVPGIRLLWEEKGTPPDPGVTVRSWLGTPVPLESLPDQVSFPILVPQASDLGAPDESYLLVENQMPIVTLIYGASPDLPAIPGSDVGLLVMQFEANADSVWLQKQLFGVETNLEIVQVHGVDALWLEGAHNLTVLPSSAETPETRTSTNVLLWNVDGVTYRIEAELPQAELIRIAESMQPVEQAP